MLGCIKKNKTFPHVGSLGDARFCGCCLILFCAFSWLLGLSQVHKWLHHKATRHKIAFPFLLLHRMEERGEIHSTAQ